MKGLPVHCSGSATQGTISIIMSPALDRQVHNYDLLLRYGYLQVLDVLTTVAFLVHGVGEGNPVVQFVMSSTGGALPGLVAVKVLAMILALFCLYTGRFRPLRRANLLFAGLVIWNLVALIISSVK